MKALFTACLLTLFAAFPKASMAEGLGYVELPTLNPAGCELNAYAPVSVYDSPNGVRIGKLVLDHPEYLTGGASPCAFQPVLYFNPEGSNRLLDVYVTTFPGKSDRLTAFSVDIRGSATWVQGKTQYTKFWLSVPTSKYFSFSDDLAVGVSNLTETCDGLGRCSPTTLSVRQLVLKASDDRGDKCKPFAYDITEVVRLPSGPKAYRIELAAKLLPKYGARLPRYALIRQKDHEGSLTGVPSDSCEAIAEEQ